MNERCLSQNPHVTGRGLPRGPAAVWWSLPLCLLICKDPAAPIDLFHCNQYSVADCSRKSSDIKAEEMKNMNQSSFCPQRVYVQVRGQGPKQRLAIPCITTSSALCWVLERQRWWGILQPGKQMSLPCWLSAGRGGHRDARSSGRGLSQPKQHWEEERGCQKDQLEDMMPGCLNWAVTAKYTQYNTQVWVTQRILFSQFWKLEV